MKKFYLAAALIAVPLMLASCGGKNPSQSAFEPSSKAASSDAASSTPSSASSEPASAPSGTSSAASQLSLDNAKELALAHANLSADKVTFTKAELDRDDGRQVYELEFITGTTEYDYEIDAASSEIISHKTETRTSGSAASQPPASSSSVTLEQAKELALAHASLSADKVTFTKAELDHDDGKQVYELEFITGTTEYDYEVDAASGEIISHKTETRTSGSAASQPPASSSLVTLKQAKELALAHANLSADKVTFTKAELDHDDGKQVYELEFITGTTEYDYEIDAASGEIISHKTETHASGSAASQPPASSSSVTLEQAKELALAHANLSADKVTFTKAELDRDDGKQVYELEFITGTTEYDYEIDAASGEIISHKTETQTSGSAASQPPASSSSVTLEQAKELALAHANLSADKVTFTKAELDRDDGKQVYELEFITGTTEYEYELDTNGNILSAESEARH